MTRKQHEAILRMVNRHWRNRCERLETEKQQVSKGVVWHTSKQLAARLQVSVRTIAYWTSDGILPSYKQGRLVRYDLNECLQALRNFRRKSRFDPEDEVT